MAVVALVLAARILQDDRVEPRAEHVHRAVARAVRRVRVVDNAVQNLANQTLEVVLGVVQRRAVDVRVDIRVGTVGGGGGGGAAAEEQRP